MWGKDYVLQVQALTINNKQSPISDPAIFRVALPSSLKKNKNTNQSKDSISNAKVFLATPNKIVLAWIDQPDAAYYKIKWDHGNSTVKEDKFVDLVDSPSSEIYITRSNTNGVIGSTALQSNGGKFRFLIYFVDKKWGKQSKPSQMLTADIKPIK